MEDNIVLEDFLQEIYEIEVYPIRDSVRTSIEPLDLYPTDLPEDFMSMVEIEKVDGEGVHWNIKLDEYEGLFGSVQSGSKTIRHGEKYKHRHEFVSEAFARGKTDQKLSTIKELGDDDDKRTPDFFLIHPSGVIHVIELTTSKTDRDEFITKAYDMKIFSYLGALENRCSGPGITFTVIVVSSQRVRSSVSLPNNLVKELVARMRLALALERRAEMISLDLEDDDKSDFKNRVKREISASIETFTLPEFRPSDEIMLRLDATIMSLTSDLCIVTERDPTSEEIPIRRDYIDCLKKKRNNLNKLPKKDNDFLIDKSYIEDCQKPPIESLVISDLVCELIRSREELLAGYEEDISQRILDFTKKFNEGTRRYDKKPITFYPFINAQEKPASSDIPKKSVSYNKDLPSVSKLWSRAMDYYELSPQKEEEDPISLINEALSEDIGKIKYLEGERKKKRRQYHRVDLKGVLDEGDLERLAEQGLWAKKFQKDEFMISRRIHQQSGFKWTTDVSDIERFLWDDSDLDKIKTLPDSRMDLLRHANKITGNSDEGVDCITEWSQTSIYQSLEIISDIAYEIAISNKQHCRTKEMILKKLRRFEVYLLISPTKSSEHTFVSLYMPSNCRIKHQGVFGKVYKVFGGYLTDFFSIKQGKLENQSSMPASLISLASFWSWFYKLKDSTPSSFKGHSEALFMLKFSILVRLEDKAQTEETITQSRYMYMEIFKSHFAISKPDPFKILEKLTTYPRSRLNLFCLKRLIKSFQMMSITPPTRMLPSQDASIEEGEESVPNDSWENLLNWISLKEVQTASKSINLVYLGYLKNKMEPAEGNTDFQIIEKTCEEEFKLDLRNWEKSMGECEGRPGAKQFSKNSIMHGCEVLEKRLESMMGVDWKDAVDKDIMDALTSRMTIEIATLKASANINHNDYLKKTTVSKNVGAGRIKVLEAMSEHLEEMGINPMSAIDKIVKKIERSSKGVMCDLFKKQQHGGPREIYVLTPESRIVQLYVETISRVLCSYFEEETLTHPKNKLKKLDEHRSNSARIASRENCVYADFCCSTDKTRWNQNLMMSALIIPLIRLTPSKFHPSITRILNLWTKKLIKLPQRVVNLLQSQTKISSPTYQKLHNWFWKPGSTEEDGHKDNIFDVKMGAFVRLSSGMMQGILHYCSSLLHLAFLNSMNRVVPFTLKKFYPNHSFFMTQVCSSDDSATILTIFSPKGERSLTNDTLMACKKTTQVLEALNNMAPYYCMKNSPKSTTALVDYVEFNSEFLFRNTIAIPIIKYVAASLNITESESYLERFHTMYNLTADLFASGFPAKNTHLCQLSQALNHYKTMGFSVNPTYPAWSSDIVKLPDPILGFFLVDCDLCPGVLGFSYSYWRCALKTNCLRRSVKSMLYDSTEIIDSGGIVQTLVVRHGDVIRWRNMVNKVSAGIDFTKEVETNPEILFREPRDLSELKTALAIKATMPSVAKSMRRGNPYMQALAMSVYSINTHCFSKSTVTQDLSGKITREHKKVSLLQELTNRLIELEDAPGITRLQMEVTFPAMERYEESQKIIDALRKYELVPCSPFRNRRTEVTVQPFSSFVPLSLLQTCLALWFGYRVKTSTSILQRCIRAYKAKIPWIKDKIEDTLEASPFLTFQELANFISSHNIKSRNFVRIGPGIFSKRLSGQLFQLIRKSQKDEFVLKDKYLPKHYSGPAEIIGKLSLALTLPMSAVRRREVERILTSSPKIYDDIVSIQKMSKRDASLAYIQGFRKKLLSKEDISTSVQQTGLGLLFAYTKMQEKVETELGIQWRGKGQCSVTCEQAIIIINMQDDKAVEIEVSSWDRVKGHASTMSTILRELHLTTLQTSTLGLRRNLVARFDGTHWGLPYSAGTPVYESRELTMRMRDVEGLDLDIGFQSISLSQMTPRGKAAMVRFKTYPGDVLPNPSRQNSSDMVDAWLNQRSLNSATAIALVLSSYGGKAQLPQLRNWILETLMARLSHKGLAKGPGTSPQWVPKMEMPQPATDVEVSEEVLTKLGLEMLEAGDKFLGIPIEELSSAQIEDISKIPLGSMPTDEQLGDWAFAFHNWMSMEIEENIDITSRGVKAFKYLHPFWDLMIDDLEHQYRGFWEDTFSGLEHSGYPELSACIIDMAKVKRRTRMPTLKEQAEAQLKIISKQMEQLEPTPIAGPSSMKDDSPSWAEEEEEEDPNPLVMYELY